MFEKNGGQTKCLCGNGDMVAIEVSDWNVANIIFVVNEELKRNGCPELVGLVNSLYDKLRKSITSDELFKEVVKCVAIEIKNHSDINE